MGCTCYEMSDRRKRVATYPLVCVFPTVVDGRTIVTYFDLSKIILLQDLPTPFSVLASVFVPYLDAGIIKGNNEMCFLEKLFIQNWLKNQKKERKMSGSWFGLGRKNIISIYQIAHYSNILGLTAFYTYCHFLN